MLADTCDVAIFNAFFMLVNVSTINRWLKWFIKVEIIMNLLYAKKNLHQDLFGAGEDVEKQKQ